MTYQHGTISRWTYGCRCVACKEARKRYMKSVNEREHEPLLDRCNSEEARNALANEFERIRNQQRRTK